MLSIFRIIVLKSINFNIFQMALATFLQLKLTSLFKSSRLQLFFYEYFAHFISKLLLTYYILLCIFYSFYKTHHSFAHLEHNFPIFTQLQVN